jgi:integrase
MKANAYQKHDVGCQPRKEPDTPRKISSTNATDQLSVEQAIEMAFTHRACGPKHKRSQLRSAKLFIDHVKSKEHITLWQDLKPYMVDDFFSKMIGDQYSANYIRLISNAICVTSKFVRRNYKNQAVDLDDIRDYTPKRSAPVIKYLSLTQLLRCIQKAREMNKPGAVLGFTVGGLAGLRISEICRLHPSCLDWDALLIGGEVKNDASKRIIPVAQPVIDVLKAFAILNYRGEQCFYKSVEAVSGQMREVLNALANDSKCEKEAADLRNIDPHQAARTTFVSILTNEIGIEDRHVQAYIGHRQTMLQRHYKPSAPVPESLSGNRDTMLALMRDRITSPLEKMLPVRLFA